jgi:excisionase family DNA binding protein
MSDESLDQVVPAKPMLTRNELAEVLSCPAHTLAVMAMQKKGPEFIKLGRSVRYPRPAVLAWMKANTRAPLTH